MDVGPSYHPLSRYMHICGLLEVIFQGSGSAPPAPPCTKAGSGPAAGLLKWSSGIFCDSNQIKSNVFVTDTWLADVNASVAKCLCF